MNSIKYFSDKQYLFLLLLFLGLLVGSINIKWYIDLPISFLIITFIYYIYDKHTIVKIK